MMRRIVVPFLLALMLCSGCQKKYALSQQAYPLQLGDTEVNIVVHEAEVPGLTLINLHDDENTSVEAGLALLRRHGGRLVELQHTGERNVRFTLRDSTYTFDPNRMFTYNGLKASLESLSADSVHSVEEEVIDLVSEFALSVLERYSLDGLDIVITLHNNTDERYSVLSYADGGDYVLDARFVNVEGDDDTDDFFFVTDANLYSQMRQAGFNVVLQDNVRATDDGSLSVYCGQNDIPYVNVEAQHGHFEQQLQMLKFLNELIAETEPGEA